MCMPLSCCLQPCLLSYVWVCSEQRFGRQEPQTALRQHAHDELVTVLSMLMMCMFNPVLLQLLLLNSDAYQHMLQARTKLAPPNLEP